jgi:Spy/CpxP family protein refolding chaperone
MTTTTAPGTGEKRSGSSFAITALVALIGLAIGGWVVWKFWEGMQVAGSGAVVSTDEKPSEYNRTAWQDRARIRNEMRERERLAAADYVRDRPRNQGGGWEVKGNKTQLTVQRANGQLRFRAESLDPNFMQAEQRQILTLRFRAVAEDAVARQLNLTDEQRQKLSAIPRASSFTIDEATRVKLEGLFKAWESATGDAKTAAANGLTAAVRELETAQESPTRQAIGQRVEEIKRIVSAEQIKAFEDMVRGR